MNAATQTANFLGSRVLMPGVVESLVRIGRHEARAMYREGTVPESWTVRRTGGASRTMSLAYVREIPRVGRALAAACKRAVRA